LMTAPTPSTTFSGAPMPASPPHTECSVESVRAHATFRQMLLTTLHRVRTVYHHPRALEERGACPEHTGRARRGARGGVEAQNAGGRR
jgi:hypothetical protein